MSVTSNDSDIEKMLNNGQIRGKLLETVKNLLGFENVEARVEPGSKRGENFMGQVFRTQFKTTDKPGTSSSLIMKVAPTDRTSGDEARLRNMFLREIFIYDEVLPFFDEFLLSKGVNPSQNGLYERAKCYGSISEQFSEAIFLEDLRLRQFEVVDIRHESLSFEHVSLVMKALGKFHAISFALKDQQPDKFSRFTNQIPELFWTFHQTEYKDHFRNMFDRLKSCMEEENRSDLSAKFQQFIGRDRIDRVFEMVAGSSAEPYSVICHGDLTTNNSMFRKDENGRAVEIQLLDWQFSRYASPVTELVLYLLCSTTKELRDKHYDEFLKIYHKSLSDLLLKLGSDPEKLFPYEALLDQFQKFGVYAGYIGVLLLPVLFADRETSPVANAFSVEDAPKMFIISDEFKKEYNKLVVGLFNDLFKFGYI